jgi:hypothetical protein
MQGEGKSLGSAVTLLSSALLEKILFIDHLKATLDPHVLEYLYHHSK